MCFGRALLVCSLLACFSAQPALAQSPPPSTSRPARPPPVYYPPPAATVITVLPTAQMASMVLGIPGVPLPYPDGTLQSMATAVVAVTGGLVSFTVRAVYFRVLYRLQGRTACLDTCTPAVLNLFTSQVCTELGLSDCSSLTGECFTFQYTAFVFPTVPDSALSLVEQACTAYILVTFQLTPSTDTAAFALAVYQQSILLLDYTVSVPGTSDARLSTALNVVIMNQGTSSITFNDLDIRTAVGGVLGLGAAYVSILVPVSVSPTPSPPPGPNVPAPCKRPHLGGLCGKDAIGAIIGIAIGGTVVLVLLFLCLYLLLVRRSTPIVMDDYQWAARFAHVINTQQGHYYAQNLKGSPYVLQPAPSSAQPPAGLYSQ